MKAAIGIADSGGLVAVSVRKVGAALDAGPMRLYSYLSTKEELLDLMVDAIYGEIISVGPIEGDSRNILKELARRVRRACQNHPWFGDLLGGRPHLGPNALLMLEASLAALCRTSGYDDIEVAMRAIGIVNAYVIGAVRSESNDLKSGLNKQEWQKLWWPYIERVIATGRFPMLATFVRDASHPSPDAVFEQGLETLLDGLAAKLPS